MKERIFQIIAGISLNGKIADFSGDFKKYSSSEDKKWLQKKINESDVLIMGRKTYEKHAKKNKKPVIIFSRKVKGLKIEPEETPELHWFHDKKEELINLCDLLQYQTVTILGGSEIYHWFINEKLVSDIFITVEPYIIGNGKNLLTGKLFHDPKSWKLKSTKTLNEKGSTLLHYQIL